MTLTVRTFNRPEPKHNPDHATCARLPNGKWHVALTEAGQRAAEDLLRKYRWPAAILACNPKGRRLLSMAKRMGFTDEEIDSAAQHGLVSAVVLHDPARGSVSTTLWWGVFSQIQRMAFPNMNSTQLKRFESLDRTLFKNEETYKEISAIVEDEKQTETADRRERGMDAAAQIVPFLKRLHPRYRQIIVARYGIADGIPRTLEEVGAELGISRERVRQIEVKAINIMRNKRRIILRESARVQQ